MPSILYLTITGAVNIPGRCETCDVLNETVFELTRGDGCGYVYEAGSGNCHILIEFSHFCLFDVTPVNRAFFLYITSGPGTGIRWSHEFAYYTGDPDTEEEYCGVMTDRTFDEISTSNDTNSGCGFYDAVATISATPP